MNSPEDAPASTGRRVLVTSCRLISVLGLVAGGVAWYWHAVAVAWLVSLTCKFQAHQWSGWPCELERRLTGKSAQATWSRWIPGAQPTEVVSNWFNAPTPEDGTRLRPWHRMQRLHLSGTFGSSSVSEGFFKNLGPQSALLILEVDDALYDDTCTAHLTLYPNLRELDITDTAVTGESLPTLPRLELLRAMSSDFTDEGCRRLATCHQLREIDLAGTMVTVEGIRTLLSLPHLEKIRVREWRHRNEVRAMVAEIGRKVEVQ